METKFEKIPKGFNEIRLRFAPSPTGYLHVGGARTALFNYLFAKSNGGKFILRIEDTDQIRSTEEATSQVLSSMAWLGLAWDEGPKFEGMGGGDGAPYYQSKRLNFYEEKVQELLSSQKIYPCFCKNDELDFKRKQAEAMGIPYIYDRKCLGLSEAEIKQKQQEGKWVYRFKVDCSEVVFEDEIKGKIKFDTQLIGDFVIRKSDGFPTYNFAVVVDDSMMRISHVLRGDDHISNTPRQILLYQALEQPIPKFYHISMILSNDGDKLSKRHGAVSVLDYQEAGYYPEPLLNHLALLGWSPEDGVEVIPYEKLLQSFRSPKFSSSPAIFDETKLDYLNGLYLRNLPDEVVLADFKKILQAKSSQAINHPKLDQLLLELKNYCKKINDIEIHLNQFLSETLTNFTEEEEKWLENETSQKLFELAREIFSQEKSDFIELDEFENLMMKAKEQGIKGKNFFMPLRLKLTGESHGLELPVYLNLQQRKKILFKLQK